MLAQTTLAAGVLAAMSVPALMAQYPQPPKSSTPEPFLQYDVPNQKPSGPSRNTSLTLPPVVHMCFAGCARGNGMTLPLENGHYVAKDGQGVAAAYDVVRFTSDEVVITRTDYRPVQTRATLTGRISADGNALIDGKAHWPTAINPFQMAWGDAIDLVPGGDRGLPAVAACDAQVTAPAALATENGVQAMERKQRTIGLCWFRIAAAQGDSLAEGALATIYYRGLGVPVNYAEAFKHASKSADAQNYLGEDCLYLIYLNGNGVPKNPEKAEFYRQLSERDKRLAEQAEQMENQRLAAQRQQQANAQQQQMQGALSLFSLFFGGSGGSSDGMSDAERESRRINMGACGNPNMPPAACGK